MGIDVDNFTLDEIETAIKEEWHCKLGAGIKQCFLIVVDRLRTAEQERDHYKSGFDGFSCELSVPERENESLRGQLKAAQSDVWSKAADCLENSSSPKAAKFWIDGMVNLFRNRANAAPVPAQRSPAVAVPEHIGNPHHWWRVEVSLYDGSLLAIEPEMLAGKSELTDRDLDTIRAAGKHLLGFAGAPDTSPRITEQDFSDDEYICIRDAVDRLIDAVGKEVDGDQSECSLCAEFIDELIKYVIKPLKVTWFEDDEWCGYVHSVQMRPRVTEQDALEIAFKYFNWRYKKGFKSPKSDFSAWLAEEGCELLYKLNNHQFS